MDANLGDVGGLRQQGDRYMTTIGIIGSGHVGSNLAKTAVAHRHDVVISNSTGPDSLTGLVWELGPQARAAAPEGAAAAVKRS
jgi:8-hydroxy-5-deazaflavin:NADPH oxidoreductase